MNKFEDFDKDLNDNSLFDINFQNFVSLYVQHESQNQEYETNLFYHCLDNEFIQHIKNNLSEKLEIKFYSLCSQCIYPYYYFFYPIIESIHI